MSSFLAEILQSLLGIVSITILAWALGEARKQIRWQPVFAALCAQIVLAIAALHFPPLRALLLGCSHGINKLKDATLAGTGFVFGYIGGGETPFAVLPGSQASIFAFKALPMVMVVSSLSMLLFHWGILPWIVRLFAWLLGRTLSLGGALGVCSAAKVFLGQTEAPLLIKPYLRKMSRSELFTVMTLGMATTAASVMVLYAAVLSPILAEPMTHILTASLISVPGAVAISRLMIPHTGQDTEGDLVSPYKFSSSMDAVATGANDGLKMYLGIIAMLVVMLALISLANDVLGLIPINDAPLSLQRLFGWLLSPLAWVMGVPWQETTSAGQLIGTKLALNEMLAFSEMAALPDTALSAKSRVILTYALCGFANFSSVGIQIAGLGAMVPERREEIVSLSMRSLVAGTLASCLSGTVLGLLYSFSAT